jgi:hypothetical protein
VSIRWQLHCSRIESVELFEGNMVLICMLNTLQITQIDDSVMLALRHQAEQRHVTVEELVRLYLRDIGTKPMKTDGESKLDKNAWLDKIFGTWTEEEYLEFERNIAPMRQIDPKLWK